jgi:hypothetical protein
MGPSTVPSRRQPRRILLSRTAVQPPSRDRAEWIATRRDQLISEVKRLREKCELTSPSIETVRRLLTRSWGRASWRTRAQLIKAADWLIRLETARANVLPDRGRQRRQGRGSAW